MRVFDIERTCVADEFCQFNKPLAKIGYSPQGDLLVSCCVDGGVAIHNPKRQHLPIKMIHLDFPPEFVHVAFSAIVNQGRGDASLDFVSDFSSGGEPVEQGRFAVMGDYGNSINLYDSSTLIVSHQILTNLQLKQFSFANNNRELAVVTTDCRVRFYSLARFEGILLRELNSVHRGSINCMGVSLNSGYLLTGGEDSMLKVWDYEAQKSLPYFFQAFIGHTYPVRGAMFCPSDNSTVISVGDKDGIYLWNFNGDVRT
jgi:WD40 repeat protein